MRHRCNSRRWWLVLNLSVRTLPLLLSDIAPFSNYSPSQPLRNPCLFYFLLTVNNHKIKSLFHTCIILKHAKMSQMKTHYPFEGLCWRITHISQLAFLDYLYIKLLESLLRWYPAGLVPEIYSFMGWSHLKFPIPGGEILIPLWMADSRQTEIAFIAYLNISQWLMHYNENIRWIATNR